MNFPMDNPIAILLKTKTKDKHLDKTKETEITIIKVILERKDIQTLEKIQITIIIKINPITITAKIITQINISKKKVVHIIINQIMITTPTNQSIAARQHSGKNHTTMENVQDHIIQHHEIKIL